MLKITDTLSLNPDHTASAELVDADEDPTVTEPYVLIVMADGREYEPWYRDVTDSARGALNVRLPKDLPF